MNNNPLFLHLKYEYYDMICNDEKTVEYREYKPYWSKRLKCKKEIVFSPGYGLDNSFDIKAKIENVLVLNFDELPDHAKQQFSESTYKFFYAIRFKILN